MPAATRNQKSHVLVLFWCWLSASSRPLASLRLRPLYCGNSSNLPHRSWGSNGNNTWIIQYLLKLCEGGETFTELGELAARSRVLTNPLLRQEISTDLQSGTPHWPWQLCVLLIGMCLRSGGNSVSKFLSSECMNLSAAGLEKTHSAGFMVHEGISQLEWSGSCPFLSNQPHHGIIF